MGCINLLLHTNQSLQGKRKQAWEQCETMLCLQFNCLFRKEAKLNNRAVHLLLQQKILLSSTCPTSCFQIPMSRSVLDFHWEGGFSSAFPPTNIFFIVLRGMGVGRKNFVGGFRLPCAPLVTGMIMRWVLVDLRHNPYAGRKRESRESR